MRPVTVAEVLAFVEQNSDSELAEFLRAELESAVSIESELLALQNEEGLIIAEEAEVWAAKHRKSELAQRLEWNEKEGARQHRINQIRQLIVTLKISYDGGQKRFYSLSIDRANKRGGGYRDIVDIMKSKTLYEVLLQDALNDLDRIKEQYDRLRELEPVWKEVDKVKGGRKPNGGKPRGGKPRRGRDRPAA
jgi:hypothetical protein